jgi:hypothetical protein
MGEKDDHLLQLWFISALGRQHVGDRNHIYTVFMKGTLCKSIVYMGIVEAWNSSNDFKRKDKIKNMAPCTSRTRNSQ